jgi:hypothetical protein
LQDQIVRGCSTELIPLEELKTNIGHYAVDKTEYDEICASDILEVIAQGLFYDITIFYLIPPYFLMRAVMAQVVKVVGFKPLVPTTVGSIPDKDFDFFHVR